MTNLNRNSFFAASVACLLASACAGSDASSQEGAVLDEMNDPTIPQANGESLAPGGAIDASDPSAIALATQLNPNNPRAVLEPMSDDDADGVPADQDLCPGTSSGEVHDANGCSTTQLDEARASASDTNVNSGVPAPLDGAAASSVPDGSVAANGFATFTLDPEGQVPVVLRTLANNVQPLANGFDLAGTVMIDVPGGERITLFEAKVILAYDDTKGEGLQSFNGSVRLPFPNFGVMQGAELDDAVHAAVGYDLGKNLKDVDAPLKDERKYVYFTSSAGFTANVGNMTVSASNNQSMTMTLDPSDPSFFMRAALGGFMGPVDEASVGFSLGGHIPFTPTNTWGISEEAATFDGHLWLGGQVNLNAVKLPIAIRGETVIDVDPDDDGTSSFAQLEQGFQFGSNSELLLSVDAKLIAFELPVAYSTIVGRAAGEEASATYSGLVKRGTDWMPELVPVRTTQDLRVGGHASTNLAETYLSAQGDMSLDAGKLGEWTGLDLNDLAMAQATLDIDQDGVLLTGTASAAFSPAVGLKGDVKTVGFFNGLPEEWSITLDGQLVVSGIDLSSEAHARLDYSGMFVQGNFETPISLIAMSGDITKDGVDVRGTGQVTIPIVAGKEVAQWVTDAAVCGTETVQDAAVCGAETVKSGAECGYTAVKDAAVCGTTTVTSAAECGTTYATSGAVCGYQTVTSGAKCGYESVVDLACKAACSIFSCDCTSTQPKSCSVPKSCNIANTCSIANTCNVANTCSVPKTCEKVKTCEQKVTIPDFDYGSFVGSVHVRIGDSGLEGSVDGEYCVTGGGCTKLAGGRIKVDSGRPEACTDIAGLGEFCAPF